MHCSIIIVGLVSLGCTITVTANPFNGKPGIAKRAGPTVTATFDGCTAVCWDASSTIQCEDVQCDQLQIPPPTPKPVLKGRAITTTVSTPTVSMEFQATDSFNCRKFCGPFEDDGEDLEACLLLCAESPDDSMTTTPDVLEVRGNDQARRASVARLAGKYGLFPRDDTVTVTVTTFPASCTVGSAIQQASVALSEASAAIAQVAGVTPVAPDLPPAASAALSEASAFLSSLAASPIAPLPVFANATIVPGPSAPSVLPVTASNSAVATSPIQPASSTVSKGAAAEGISMDGVYLFQLTNLLTHVAFIFVAYMI